jgi:hypothetical protein
MSNYSENARAKMIRETEAFLNINLTNQAQNQEATRLSYPRIDSMPPDQSVDTLGLSDREVADSHEANNLLDIGDNFEDRQHGQYQARDGTGFVHTTITW